MSTKCSKYRQPVTDSRQKPLFSIQQFRPHPYKPTSFFGVLDQFGELVIDRNDFDFPLTGAPGWCPVMMSKLVIIQRKHGWTDRETIDRANNDLRVKACLNLGLDQDGPSQTRLSQHRALMQRLGVVEVYEQRFISIIKALDLLGDDEPVLIDSAPVRGAGQVLDTYNLLGAAIRQGLKRLANATGDSEQEVAKRLELCPFLDRSIKGRFEVDWEDPESRQKLLAELVAAAYRLLDAINNQVERHVDPNQNQSDTTGDGFKLQTSLPGLTEPEPAPERDGADQVDVTDSTNEAASTAVAELAEKKSR
jgi:hypothetical protein